MSEQFGVDKVFPILEGYDSFIEKLRVDIRTLKAERQILVSALKQGEGWNNHPGILAIDKEVKQKILKINEYNQKYKQLINPSPESEQE